ncbi:MAG: TIGR03960 family B12-binding radical SAM protein, partial [Candidatus Brocadiia bacterium]
MDIRAELTTRVLPLVRNPAQYIGGELNSIVKTHQGRLRFALVFPDTYTIGMSHLGLRIIYDVLNQRDDIVCERAFCPEKDMEEQLRHRGVPLYTLETFTPLASFDIVGFSLQYELCYSNVLTILSLAGIPLLAADRTDEHPLILGGGPCCGNPEPVADFFDAFLLGDGEKAVVEIADLWRKLKISGGMSRRDALTEMASRVQGLYVPSLYSVEYAASGRISSITPKGNAPAVVRSALVMNLEEAPFPMKPIVPVIEVVHDRITVEIMRGCLNGCRFCSAGMQYRPQRLRSPARILEIARACYAASGHDTIGLLSLSSSDHPQILEIVESLNREFRELRVGVALPSLRVGKALFQLPAILGDVRKSGLTMAPEVATERLRGVISKMISDDALLDGAREAFRNGWRLVKLYFMIGLPGEKPEDRQAIALLCNSLSNAKRQIGGGPANVNATVSTFVPKPHTPFQWAAQISPSDELEYRREILSARPQKTVNLKFDKPEISLVEGYLARGNRRVGAALLEAWNLGARLDAWPEHFRFDLWREAADKSGVSFEEHALRERSEDEVLPSSHL